MKFKIHLLKKIKCIFSSFLFSEVNFSHAVNECIMFRHAYILYSVFKLKGVQIVYTEKCK